MHGAREAESIAFKRDGEYVLAHRSDNGPGADADITDDDAAVARSGETERTLQFAWAAATLAELPEETAAPIEDNHSLTLRGVRPTLHAAQGPVSTRR
jgi:hypothetical protein